MLDVLIRAGILAVMVLFCFEIFRPFLNLMLWAVILAITLYPLHGRLARKLGTSSGHTATLMILIAVAILMVPVYLLGTSLVGSVENAMAIVRLATIWIPFSQWFSKINAIKLPKNSSTDENTTILFSDRPRVAIDINVTKPINLFG